MSAKYQAALLAAGRNSAFPGQNLATRLMAVTDQRTLQNSADAAKYQPKSAEGPGLASMVLQTTIN